MPSRLFLLFALAVLAGCETPTRQHAAPADIYRHNTHSLAMPPQAAAACIARNAEKAGYSSVQTPLYGREVMAVTVRTLPAGGIDIATVQLLSEGTGSRAVSATTPHDVPDSEKLLKTLLAGC